MQPLRRSVPAAVALLLSLAACGPTDEAADARERDTGYRGIALPEPVAVPDFTLTDTDGRRFDFLEETEGRVALLFFGYTHCPDVCPVHMANLGAVLEGLPSDVRREIRVVFVTTDPARDSLPRLRSWLDRWDPSFVGLRGEMEEVNRIQRRLNLPPAVTRARGAGGAAAGDTAAAGAGATVAAAGTARPDSDYIVGHASQVLAIDAGGRVRVVYPFGTRQADWAHDLPKLVRDFGRPGGTAPGG